MEIKEGQGTTKYGPGVDIKLTAAELALAIDAYLVAHDVVAFGPRTITVNGALVTGANVYVDPGGYVIAGGNQVPPTKGETQ